MPRYLIWSIAFDERGRRLAPLWLDAIKSAGRWTDDIVLLGNNSICDLSAPNTQAIDIEKDVEKRYALPRAMWTLYTFNNLKSQIQYYVAFSKYDYILYLDLDVLVNSADLYKEIQLKHERGLVTVQRDYIGLPRGRLAALERLGMPDEAELIRWTMNPVCAGVMGFPTTPLGLKIFQDYYLACREMGFQYSDQAKLSAVLYRKYPNDWDFMANATFGRRSSPRYSEALVHFTGTRDAIMITYYWLQLKRVALPRRLWLQAKSSIEGFLYRRWYRPRAASKSAVIASPSK
jgi:hypothetical protein